MLVSFKVKMSDHEKRLDLFLVEAIGDRSRSNIQKLIKEGRICVAGKIVPNSYRVQEGEMILCSIPEPEAVDVMPEDIPLDIAYEDEDVILINKPKDMVVHPGVGHYTGTLVNALLHHCEGSLSGINGVLRPGIVHRIDKNTTGIVIACKNDTAHASIAQQLKEHSITRRYRAIVHGILKDDEGTINNPIGRHATDRKKMWVGVKNAKTAVTHYRVLERFKEHTYIECVLKTGRTHQIRVHLSSINHPLLGDTLYGGKKHELSDSQVLHAMVLGFVHPTTGEYLEFTAPLPEYFGQILDELRRNV